MPTTTGLATSFISFSRPGASGGGATVTDRDGKIKWAGHNLLTNSESFDASAWLKNGAVVVTANAAVAPNGTTTADRLNTPSGVSTYQQAAIIAGAKYKIAVWVKRSGSTNQTFRLFGDSAILSSDLTATADWQLFEFEFTAATGGATRDNGITGGTGAAAYDITVWGAHLYRSDLGGMQLNPAMPAGMQSYYPTTPRNLAKYGEDWGSAFWSTFNVAASANSTIAPNGLQTADLIYPTSTGTNRQTYLNVNSGVSGTRVVASAYLKSGGLQWAALLSPNGANYGCYFDLVNGVKGAESSGVTGTITSVGNGWYRCSVSEVLSGTAIYGGISLADANSSTTVTVNGTSGVYAWGLQFSDSASLDTYVPQYGAAVTSAAYYAPRLDFDPVTLAAKGLLVEELRTNLLLRSADFGNASWAKAAGVTVTDNTEVAPDGTTTADTVNSGGNEIGQSAAVSQNTTYTVSLFFRKTSGATYQPGMYLLFTGGTTVVYCARLNTDTGVATAVTAAGFTAPAGFSVTGHGNYWRLSITGSSADNTSGALRLYANLNAAGNASTGSQIIYGAQLEAGSFATSYIPTAGATVTRSADVASVATSQFPYSSTEGTLVVSATLRGGSSAAAAGDYYISLSDGTTANSAHIVDVNATISQVVASNNATFNQSIGSRPAIGSTVKLAMAYAANDANSAVNGTAGTTDTTVTLPPAATKLGIGIRADNAFPINGHIRQITYIPRRISNAELQSRTV